MEALVPILLLVALAAASLRWGADSRPDPASARPARWFITLEGPGRLR
ncbi:MAG: hypothetical protein J2P45_04860 [Candidatus Dormibacteraeota bacterium]|nr:hypothetical protein [Candidatus Dormibacteraeota bacterium]